MSLRRLCNVAYAVLVEGVPIELRAELDRRLRGPIDDVETAGVLPPAGHTLASAEPSRDEIAAANRKAMASLMGMMPGATRA